jgi:hypothetical protein
MFELTYFNGFCFYYLIFWIVYKICRLYFTDTIKLFRFISEVFGLIHCCLAILHCLYNYYDNYNPNYLKWFVAYYIITSGITVFDYVKTKSKMSFAYIIHHILAFILLYLAIYEYNNINTLYLILVVEITNFFKYLHCFNPNNRTLLIL